MSAYTEQEVREVIDMANETIDFFNQQFRRRFPDEIPMVKALAIMAEYMKFMETAVESSRAHQRRLRNDGWNVKMNQQDYKLSLPDRNPRISDCD